MENIFTQRLILLCQEKNITPQQLRHYISVKSATITQWTKGQLLPNCSTLQELSKFFNCSIDYLLGLTDIEDIITSKNLKTNIPKEYQHIIERYKSLSVHDKEIVDHIFSMKQEDTTKIYLFPVFYQSAAAGIGRLSETDDYNMEELQIMNIPKEAKFGMYIEGHSMETTMYEHDIVLIDPVQNDPSNLDDKIVVARFGDELICKRLSVNENNQTYDFNSENSLDKDKGRYDQKQSNFTLVGKVVKIIHAHKTGFGNITYGEY
ncbi:helix-turn-helix domain-containing protein [bacterium 1xD42-87]|nr:helix-turn-helix domain-containing protein [bacterium 1xD42-87]